MHALFVGLALALTYFAGLPSVSATYPGSDGTPHAVHLFFEVTPVGPRYVGVILEPGV